RWTMPWGTSRRSRRRGSVSSTSFPGQSSRSHGSNSRSSPRSQLADRRRSRWSCGPCRSARGGGRSVEAGRAHHRLALVAVDRLVVADLAEEIGQALVRAVVGLERADEALVLPLGVFG